MITTPNEEIYQVEDNTKLTNDFWKNVPIVDATEMLVLFPKKIDLIKAQSGDPENCVYARCIKRVWPKSRRVRIWREVALVEAKNERGETIALRYKISSPGKRALKTFDQGLGELVPCTLLPPAPSGTLEAVRLKEKLRREGYKGRKRLLEKAKAAGTHKPNRWVKPEGDFMIRSGIGHHQYSGVRS